MSLEDEKRKREKLRLLQKKKSIRESLPHLYGFKWYKWAWEFFSSTNKDCFLCAANQISKSSTQIRKSIDWSTDQSKWPSLWPTRKPLQFWYLYPTKEVATIEFEKKWVPEFLPRGEFKADPVYGWDEEYKAGYINAIHFRSGVSIYFKTYATDVKNLQTGTCDAIFCDEELPSDLYDELNQRRSATDGYFSMVFTATLGQEFWREVIEERGTEHERFPEAAKWQVSKYDCLYYMDGTPGPWTVERIEREKKKCKSEAEIQRRIYGRFVVDEGLKYPGFCRARNVKPAHPLPRSWSVYAGIDPGGGGDSHPGAIVFVAVSPDFRQGRIFRGWRGDESANTTSYDILEKYIELSKGLNVVAAYYDYADKDIQTFATSKGIALTPADKSHDTGERTLNVLFKNDMLAVYDLPELEGLPQELTTLQIKTLKTKAKDDYIDATRYACVLVPWDFDGAIESGPIQTTVPKTTDEIRAENHDNAQEIADEFEEWNELLYS